MNPYARCIALVVLLAGTPPAGSAQEVEDVLARAAAAMGSAGVKNKQGLLEIVEARIQHPVLGETLVQTIYSEYKDFGGLKFPTTIIQKLGGSLTSVLIVSGVQGN